MLTWNFMPLCKECVWAHIPGGGMLITYKKKKKKARDSNVYNMIPLSLKKEIHWRHWLPQTDKNRGGNGGWRTQLFL